MDRAKKILKKYYGYEEFRPGQAQIIANLLGGRDTVAIMPTGAGKSLCFQIPALLLPGVTLVISPLISLMKDQVDALNSQGIPAVFINSSLTNAEMNQRLYRAITGEYKLIYAAPERLLTEQFQNVLNKLDISLLAIDEAHCVSQWGHDFRPSYQSISIFIKQLSVRPVIGAFTATATPEVKRDIINLLALKNPQVHVTGFDRKNLSFAVLRGENKKKFVQNYVEAHKGQTGIIYTATRKETDKLYELLRLKRYAVGRYHAGMSDEERTVSQEAFLYDNIQVMVATNAFGMGIDKSNVRYVLHYNMPKNMESYYQEAGRAGRDGEPGECILLFGPQDPLLQKFLIEQSVENPERKKNELNKLQTMVDYCHTPECLRKFILGYFGEQNSAGECGNCGNCSGDSEVIDITVEAQKIFSCIFRMKERYGVSLVADVLKGAKNKKVLEAGLNSLSTYGLFSKNTVQEIKDMINRLIATGYLYLTEGEYPVVKLLPKAILVLKNKERIWQKVFEHKKQEEDDGLFEELRRLRKAISDREKVPPYVVFADSTLKEMSKICPTDLEGLRQIKGVGEVKLEKYGEAFLNVICHYQAGEAAAAKKVETPSHMITLSMFEEGMMLEQIAKVRNLKITTLEEHLIRCSREGHKVNWDALIPLQYEQLILAKIKEVGTEKLKPIKEALPADVNYTAIKAVLCKYFGVG